MARIVIRCQYTGHYVFTGFDTRPRRPSRRAIFCRIASPNTCGAAPKRGSTIASVSGGRSRWFARRAKAVERSRRRVDRPRRYAGAAPHQFPSSGMFKTVPHALQCTASGSWRSSAHCGQRKRTFGLQQRARQVEEQRHAQDHDDDRDQPPGRAGQRDVAEAGRGQRGDGEVERVGIVGDVLVAGVLGLVDDAGHDEDEDRQMRDREHRVFALAEPRAVLAQPRQQLIGVQQPHRAQDAQEAGAFADHRREERHDRGDVCPGGGMQQLAQPRPADGDARGEVGEDRDAEHDIDPLDDVAARQERRRDDEQDGQKIEREQGIAEAMAVGRVELVVIAKLSPADRSVRNAVLPSGSQSDSRHAASSHTLWPEAVLDPRASMTARCLKPGLPPEFHVRNFCRNAVCNSSQFPCLDKARGKGP